MKILFINSSDQPFVDRIMILSKLYETRTRNTLKRLINETVYIAETGKGRPVVKCSLTIGKPIKVTSLKEWNQYRDYLGIPVGSKYDWTDSTKVKYLYPLSNVRTCDPFVPVDGIRHGRVWMEF